LICNVKDPREIVSGDTYFMAGEPVAPLPRLPPPKPTVATLSNQQVFAGIFPVDARDFPRLEESLTKLLINDTSVSLTKESRQITKINYLVTR
jgi:translation elongation factor EF-4